MGALPKNKITRAERGKRRAGNTPSITKDFRISRTPSRKQGLVDSMFAAIGLSASRKTTAETAKDDHKKDVKHESVKPLPASVKAPQARQPVTRQTRITQHKG